MCAALAGERPCWIAIEGLDGSGKSTLARLVAQRIGAALVKNPPESLSADRPAADARPERDRRAWYAFTNRVASEEAARHRDTGRAVVMDRCAASTLAFGAAHAGTVAQPEDWPPDVGRPDLIVLLDVPEAVRVSRLPRRSVESPEEVRLRDDHEFRARVLAGYRALGAIQARAEGSPEEIAADILGLIEENRRRGSGRGQ